MDSVRQTVGFTSALKACVLLWYLLGIYGKGTGSSDLILIFSWGT